MFGLRRTEKFINFARLAQQQNQRNENDDEAVLLDECAAFDNEVSLNDETTTEQENENTGNDNRIMKTPSHQNVFLSNGLPRAKFVAAWKKPQQNIEKEKEEEKENKHGVAKMAKVVTTASNVDKASKSLLSSTIRRRLKDRMRKIAEERLTVKQIFRRYVDTSTLHGFRYTCSDTYLIRRFIWAVLMVLGTVYFIVKLKEGIIEYMSYPFSTLSTLEYVTDLTFPAISFCTVNQFKKSKILDSPLKTLYKNKRLPIYTNWSDPGYDIPGDEFVKELKRTSFSIRDIFKECDYIRRKTDHPHLPPNNCSHQNFTSYFSETGQLCFTLNSGKVGHRLLSVDHEGLKFGFEAMFDLQNDDAVHTFGYSGLQAIVHDQNELPTSNFGLMLTSGFKTYVSMQRVETKNLPPPYDTHCGEKKLKYFDIYSQKACLLESLTDYVGEQCGCREPFMPDNRLPYCSLRETILCALEAKESFNDYEMRLECPIDCEITSYTTRLSDARFVHNPPKGIDPILLEKEFGKRNLSSHLLNLSNRMNQKELDAYIERNIIVVIFFFGEMSKVVNEQEASFDFYQFLGDMGGEIGLMLGASLLTFVEFVDVFAFLGYHQILRFHKRKKEVKESRKLSLMTTQVDETTPV